jgi:hypothetical protein
MKYVVIVVVSDDYYSVILTKVGMVWQSIVKFPNIQF